MMRHWTIWRTRGEQGYSGPRLALPAEAGGQTDVVVVALADVIDVLDRTYHPQMGENPTHPVDVIREHFEAGRVSSEPAGNA